MAVYWNDNSLLFAPQSAFGTVNSTPGDFEALLCEKPSITFATDIQELDLLTGQVGASPERLIGRRSGTMTFKTPLEGFKSGYDPTAEDPGAAGVIPPWLALLANALGSNNSAIVSAATQWAGAHLSNSDYDASGVASATTSVITADAGTDITTDADIKAGQLVITAESPTSTTLQMGFAKSLAGAALTLFEASKQAVNSATADFYGTANAWLSNAVYTQVPQTVKWVGNSSGTPGNDTKFCYVLQDVIVEGITLEWNAGAVPTAEFRCRFYDYSMDKTLGGLVVPDAFARIPQIVGTYNGYATLSGGEKCGLANCTVDFALEIVEVPCHGATQGIEAVSYRKPKISAKVSILHEDGDLVYDAAGGAGNTGSHVWQAALELGTTLSLGCYVGARSGRSWAWLIPACKVVEVPALEDRDGSVAYSLTVEAVAYSGDTAISAETVANSPIDSVFRTAVG
jgi:hypothetical protein